MAPFNHFDLLAPYYDRFIKPRDITRFSSLLQLPTTGMMLDVGGGTGQKSLPLLGLAGGIIVLDSSMGMLTQAKQKDRFKIICSESEQLPLVDGCMERVIIVDALHHVRNYRDTCAEMWRVTKPGGRIVIEEPDIRRVIVKLLALFEKIALMRSHFISPPIIADCFNYPSSRININVDDSTAWIIIDKQA
jgi:ubiquinone/menaquinone biosynthesis C-methylase UbiE